MRKTASLVAVLGLCLFASGAFAQGESDTATTGSDTDWKQELRSDKKDIRDQKNEIMEDGLEAKAEERALLRQIEEAKQAGDMQRAKDLRDQLHAVHQANVQEMQQNRKDLRDDRHELKSDVKDARQEGWGRVEGLYDDQYNKGRFDAVDANKDGVLNKDEIAAGQKGFEHYREGERFKHTDTNADGVISFDEAKIEKQWEKENRNKLAKEARDRGDLPPGAKDRLEDVGDRREDRRDHREDIRDKREDRKDRLEDIRDKKEDIKDRREDKWDATHNYPPGTPEYRKDRLEDIRDKKEDIRDKREDKKDRREDIRDKKEDRWDKKEDRKDKKEDIRDKKNRGVRDHGAGVGAGKGQGGMHRSGKGGKK